MVIEDLAAMRARNDQERTILLTAVIEQNADGKNVVIGVRIEGPVLVPFYGSTVSPPTSC